MKIIVITPVKNEAWILEDFLRAASLYADHIVLSDQNSSDGSVEIARRFPKVTMVQNSSKVFNELGRQEQLLLEARKFGDNNLIIALDADEFLSPNFFKPETLAELKGYQPGTAIEVGLANLLPNLEHYWQVKLQPIIMVDDGSDNRDLSTIHRRRLPTTKDTPTIQLTSVKVLHFQFIDWSRMLSKHRWYQMYERVNFPEKSIIEIYRTYHHMFSIRRSMLRKAPAEWLDQYEAHGVHLRFLPKNLKSYWWDAESDEMLKKYGYEKFKMIDIWSNLGQPRPSLTLRQKLVWKYLTSTQRFINLSAPTPLAILIYLVDKSLTRVVKNL